MMLKYRASAQFTRQVFRLELLIFVGTLFLKCKPMHLKVESQSKGVCKISKGFNQRLPNISGLNCGVFHSRVFPDFLDGDRHAGVILQLQLWHTRGLRFMFLSAQG
ncbi:MAG: hypothetical protein KBF98_02685 [Rhodoferax sp.]|jgi:hypothetical protein|nr:hypothetical protein [Rhodoferax sp.]